AKDIRPFWKRWPVIGTALLLGVGLPINIMAWWPESEKAPEPVKQQNTNIEIPAGTPTAQGTAAPAKKKPKSDFGPLD
ncbi:hypothetical protein OFP00_40270, partial [Escherichia coli]|nr:hypothetical protein [Escherichia coli]